MKVKKSKSRKWWGLLLLSVFTLVLSACMTTNGQSELTTLEKAQERGTVTVGFANEQPYAYMNSDLELTGISVEIADAIFERLGIEQMQGVLTEFAILIPGLQAERFDAVTAGMFITPSRAAAEGAQFANPEFTVGEAIAVKAGNPKDLHSYEDVAVNEDVSIAAVAGTIEYDYLLASGVPENQIISVPDNASALSALQSGRVDAFTVTEPTIRSILDQANDPSVEVEEDFKQPIIDGEEVKDYSATVFRSADQDFIEAWNTELRKMEESGELLEIYEKYGFTADNLPGGISPEEALK